METQDRNWRESRPFDTISPTAKALLFMKGYTPIPFMKEAARLAAAPEVFEPDFSKRDFGFWSRVLHFENRYRCVDQLYHERPVTNVLELSSGFSFRGLDLVSRERGVHYIDTDLPGVIGVKQGFIDALRVGTTAAPGSLLELLPLNALDERGFREVVGRLPAGELAVLNEGLLVYLGLAEKKELCRIIRGVLRERGGYWITGDIYIRFERTGILQVNDELGAFFEKHRVNENMFGSFSEAEDFFKEEGFVLDKEAEPEYANLSGLPYLLQSATEEKMEALRKAGKVHAVWRLRLR